MLFNLAETDLTVVVSLMSFYEEVDIDILLSYAPGLFNK